MDARENDIEPDVVMDDSETHVAAYLKKMAEKDERRRKKAYGKHGKLIWNSREQGTYRKPKLNREIESDHEN